LILTRLAAACLLVVSCGSAQSQHEDPAALLHIRANASGALSRIHNCACLWTVEVSGWSRNKLEWRERYRMEMAFLDGREVFAWPGSNAFEPRELTDAVHTGAVSTGNLAISLYNIFVADSATIRAGGSEVLAGHEMLRFRFDVPLLRSEMTLRVAGEEMTVPYSGTFWADPATFALHQMEIRAEVPGMTVVRHIDYEEAALAGENAYVPTRVRMTATDAIGNQSRSKLTRGECRKFTADSALSFDAAPTPAAHTPPPPRAAAAVPAGLSLRLKLDAEIDSDTAAAGDRISAWLDRAVQSGSLALPKRSAVRGRITRAYQSWTPDRTVRLGLAFHEAGGDAPLSLKCDLALRTGGADDRRTLDTGSLTGRVATPERRPDLTILDNELSKDGTRLVLPRGFPLLCTTR
jgi:hypothetical protein